MSELSSTLPQEDKEEISPNEFEKFMSSVTEKLNLSESNESPKVVKNEENISSEVSEKKTDNEEIPEKETEEDIQIAVPEDDEKKTELPKELDNLEPLEEKTMTEPSEPEIKQENEETDKKTEIPVEDPKVSLKESVEIHQPTVTISPKIKKKKKKFIDESPSKPFKRHSFSGRSSILKMAPKVDKSRRQEIEDRKREQLSKRPQKTSKYEYQPKKMPSKVKNPTRGYLKTIGRWEHYGNPRKELANRKQEEKSLDSKKRFYVQARNAHNVTIDDMRKKNKKKFSHLSSTVMSLITDKSEESIYRQERNKKKSRRYKIQKKREKEEKIKRDLRSSHKQQRGIVDKFLKKKNKRIMKKVKPKYNDAKYYRPKYDKKKVTPSFEREFSKKFQNYFSAKKSAKNRKRSLMEVTRRIKERKYGNIQPKFYEYQYKHERKRKLGQTPRDRVKKNKKKKEKSLFDVRRKNRERERDLVRKFKMYQDEENREKENEVEKKKREREEEDKKKNFSRCWDYKSHERKKMEEVKKWAEMTLNSGVEHKPPKNYGTHMYTYTRPKSSQKFSQKNKKPLYSTWMNDERYNNNPNSPRVQIQNKLNNRRNLDMKVKGGAFFSPEIKGRVKSIKNEEKVMKNIKANKDGKGKDVDTPEARKILKLLDFKDNLNTPNQSDVSVDDLNVSEVFEEDVNKKLNGSEGEVMINENDTSNLSLDELDLDNIEDMKEVEKEIEKVK